MTSAEELIEQLERGHEPLSSIALALENAARAVDASAAAQVRQELDGYNAGTPKEKVAEVRRRSDVLGLMKLSALESRLAAAEEKAAAGPSDAAGELARIRARGDAEELRQLLAERRQFLINIARRIAPAGKTHQRWVTSIHGIMTRGAWQKQLAPLLSERGFHPWLFDYKWYDPIRMLFEGSRNNKVDEFQKEYGHFKDGHQDVVPSIVAHSMGSYIVTRAIEKYGLTFDRVILCGAIVREDYPWNDMVAAGRINRVLHDYGRKDIWARMAIWLISDAGQSGYKGFEQEAGGTVVQRRHAWYRHSDYFNRTNFVERWIPFLGGTDPDPIPPEVRPRPNWRHRLLQLIFFAVIAAIVWAVFGR
jgi:pimeloyl-ACP methyl ester carboxylesterase